jgi:hypothetical protein
LQRCRPEDHAATQEDADVVNVPRANRTANIIVGSGPPGLVQREKLPQQEKSQTSAVGSELALQNPAC